MTQAMNRSMRRIQIWLAAGTLLQLGGCVVDPTALAAGLFQSIINTFVADLVFGLFNVGGI